MRVLVYPHSMEVGGSQLNAVDLAAAVRDRGHEVVVYSERGALVTQVHDHGMEHIVRRPSRISPGPASARHLLDVIRRRRIDVVHAWEWPPILESYAAATTRAAVVGSVMSMGVAGFLPTSTLLTVGTQQLLEQVAPGRSGRTVLLEPPVDIKDNSPGEHAADFRRAFPSDPGIRQVVVVSRLAHELKLEGILTAVESVSRLAVDREVRLVIVGDGPARQLVADAAAAANLRMGREIVVLTGELRDPRGAYDSADVCLGMGGSALRALAFGKPLIVQGEGGFFETCTPETVTQFLEAGWYGVADRDHEDAVEHLSKALDLILTETDLRAALSTFGRDLVAERYSLGSAATTMLRLYEEADRTRSNLLQWIGSGVAAAPHMISYKLDRQRQRLRGSLSRDDFNVRRA